MLTTKTSTYLARHESTATEVKSFATILLSPVDILTASNNDRVHLYSKVAIPSATTYKSACCVHAYVYNYGMMVVLDYVAIPLK